MSERPSMTYYSRRVHERKARPLEGCPSAKGEAEWRTEGPYVGQWVTRAVIGDVSTLSVGRVALVGGLLGLAQRDRCGRLELRRHSQERRIDEVRYVSSMTSRRYQ